MKFRRFRKFYGLELLPTSHSETTLGDLVWKPARNRACLVKRGMANHIYNVFSDLGLVTDREWMSAMNFFESEAHYPAELGDLRIDTGTSFARSFDHPVVQLLPIEMEDSNFESFTFTQLRRRHITGLWRRKIQNHLGNIPPGDYQEIAKRHRPIHLITELYYGNIAYHTDRKGSVVLDSLLKKEGHQSIARYLRDNDRVYEFDHHQVPFCMRIEPLIGFKA
ncbi:MAG: hypothetical protein ACPIA1_02710 [Flavobacteriaceae bacterium]